MSAGASRAKTETPERMLWAEIYVGGSMGLNRRSNRAGSAPTRASLAGKEALITATPLSAAELSFCEGFMERGKTFLGLVRGWKSGSEAPYLFKNYLIALGGGKAPASEHARLRFARANADYLSRLFGSEQTAEDILSALRLDHET